MINQPIRKTLNKIDAAGRLIQWAIELGPFDIKYRPRVAIKAQVLANFIAEFTYPCKEEEPLMEIWTVQIDGSATKKVEGVGVVLIPLKGETLKYAVRLQFPATNNEAEYEALLTRLSPGKALRAKSLIDQADSQLIIGQVKGDYEAKEERVQKYSKIFQRLSQHFDYLDFAQIPGAKNVEADFLTRLALSDNYNATSELCIEIRGPQSIEGEQVLKMKKQDEWMTPIVCYLKEGWLAEDKAEARKIQIRATRFVIIDDVLYRRGYSLPYLRCANSEEAHYVLREINRVYRNHAGARSLAGKALRVGYHWPTLQNDAYYIVRICDKCQRFANVQTRPGETLTPISLPWPSPNGELILWVHSL